MSDHRQHQLISRGFVSVSALSAAISISLKTCTTEKKTAVNPSLKKNPSSNMQLPGHVGEEIGDPPPLVFRFGKFSFGKFSFGNW